MLRSTHMSTLAPEFSFAGFEWPRYQARLPKGSLIKRLEARRTLCCGEYYRTPRPNETGGSFYLESDFMIGNRWTWADEVSGVRGIDHTGWLTDEHGDGDKIRGLVVRLSHGRFLAGWSMGEGMASKVEPRVFEDEAEAAHAADHMAEHVAEMERDRVISGEDE